MVMLANNKTVHQINNDLQLFLGANTDRFTAWLHRAMSDPAVMMETTSEEREAVVPQGMRETIDARIVNSNLQTHSICMVDVVILITV